MPSLDPPPSLLKITVHAPHGLAYVVYAVFVALYAIVGQRLYTTSGEPYATAMLELDRIEATNQLMTGLDERNLLSLQAGLTKAADLPTFNDTLFDDSKALLKSLRMGLDELTAAVETGEREKLAVALKGAIVLHTDGRPVVDRYHLRSAAKKLQSIANATKATLVEQGKETEAEAMESELAELYGEVKEALVLSRGKEAEEEPEEPPEKKLPSKWLPAFWACFCAFLLCEHGVPRTLERPDATRMQLDET